MINNLVRCLSMPANARRRKTARLMAVLTSGWTFHDGGTDFQVSYGPLPAAVVTHFRLTS
jgi:hypothetical protein